MPTPGREFYTNEEIAGGNQFDAIRRMLDAVVTLATGKNPDGSDFLIGTNSSPAAKCDAVTPDDDNDLAHSTRGLMVSVGGDVKVDFLTAGTEIVLPGLLAGVVYPFQVKKVYNTGTTATGILALY